MTQFHVAQTQKKIPVLYLFSLIVLLGNLFRNKIKILDKKTQITRSPGNLHQFVKLKPTNLFARHRPFQLLNTLQFTYRKPYRFVCFRIQNIRQESK